MSGIIRDAKPEPVTVATGFLSDDKLRNLINFIEFLHVNEYKLRWRSSNAWEIKIHNTQILRRLRVNTEEKNWFVNLHFFWEYNNHITDDELINFVWSNIRHNQCHHKTTNCQNYSTINILGKKFDMTCCVGQITIFNPAGKELKYAKELVSIAKVIVENAAIEKRIDGRSRNRLDYSLIGSPSIT